VTLDIARTAALVIDMQNDFRATGGMFERAGIDTSMIQAAVEPTARALAANTDVLDELAPRPGGTSIHTAGRT
jgi:nicotinamidase-related amidase